MRRITLLLLCSLPALAAELVLPDTSLERTAPVRAFYRTQPQATGKGELTLRWTDAFGRLVEERKLAVELNDEVQLSFPLDLRRAVTMRNQLSARFTFEGVNKRGAPDRRNEEAKLDFIAKPDARWWDYHVIMWQHHSPQHFARLKTVGIDGGMYSGRSKTPPDFLLENDLRWYSENIATDFYSEYHRYRSDRPVDYSFRQAKELYKKDPTSLEPFKRHPSFSDPAWIKKIRERLQDAARANSPYRPFFYSLGDESGIADLASFWDFDYSDHSLEGLREWLKERYGTLAALNAQWGSHFDDWNLVVPDTTDAAMRRSDANFSSWADMKEWMDISYTRALKMGNDAIRAVDPAAYIGIGGGQMPGWGGYDYWRISHSLTAIEPYDIGNNIELLRSFNPRMAVLTTGFAHGPMEQHRVWYELLHGNRGLILWDDKHEFISPEGVLGDRAAESKPYYTEIRSGLGALLINSHRLADPIAIHYSQASMRTAWMLAHQPRGSAWAGRSSGSERRDSHFLHLRESWCRLIEDQSLQYNFVAYAQVENGELLRRGYRVLVLPDSSSLSQAEAREIRAFVEQGGTLLTDRLPGAFDEHSRRLPASPLADLFEGLPSAPVAQKSFGKGKVVLLGLNIVEYQQDRLTGKEQETHAAIGRLLAELGLRAEAAALDAQGQPATGVEVHRFQNGGAQVVALHSNPSLRVNELGPPEFRSNKRFEKPQPVTLTLPREMYVIDIRAGKSLGRLKQVPVEVNPHEPSIFLISSEPAPALRLAAPASVARGALAEIGVSFDGSSPLATHALHFDVTGPDGQRIAYYSQNLLGTQSAARITLPLAQNDAPGKWQITVKDIATAQSTTQTLEVR